MADGDLTYTPEDPNNPYPLGRSVQWHDPQNRAYSVRPLLASGTLQDRPWYTRHNFDQQGSSCTMQAAIGVTFSSPFRKDQKVKALHAHFDTEAERHSAYLQAQHFDPWAGGEPQYEGSSTDAPFKYLRHHGYISGWRWCFGIQDLRDTLRKWGPVSVGTVWYHQMFFPRVNNREAFLEPGDYQDVGGHAFEVVWWDEDEDEYLILNSWGRSWGFRGRAKIKGKFMEHLLIEKQGEAATVVL